MHAQGRRVLLVADGPEPVDDVVLLVRLVDREVDHEPAGSGAVPMLLVGLEEDAVTGADDLDGPDAALAEAHAFGDEHRLAERVPVPMRPGAGNSSEGYPVTERHWQKATLSRTYRDGVALCQYGSATRTH